MTVRDSYKKILKNLCCFYQKKAGNIFKITGGGYGHGIGMSQNGANEMAKTGKNYQEILQMFYPGTTIEK